MTLAVRPAVASDYDGIEKLLLESFEPITWQKKLDGTFGPLNGLDWRERWRARIRDVFAKQIVLAGELQGGLMAMSSGTLDLPTRLCYIDLLAIDRRFQGQGYGREMLHAAMRHFQSLGARYCSLDCLTDNDAGNALYASEGFVEVARQIRWFRPI